MGNLRERQIGSISRRRFLEAAVATGAAVMFGGCGASPARPTNTAAASEPSIPTAAPTEVLWQALTPLDRINRLEVKNFPPKKDFDPDKELISAVADYFCQITQPSLSADQLKQSVHLVGTDEFVNQIEKEEEDEGPLDPGQRQDLAENVLERFIRKSGHIYINVGLLDNYSVSDKSLDVRKKLGVRDFKRVALKSILLHSFAHATQTVQTVAFIDDPFEWHFKNKSVVCGKLDGFSVKCDGEGGEANYLPADEAVTDYVARTVADTGKTSYMSFNQNYTDGAVIIDQLNKISVISPKEFIAYANGNAPIADLFTKWGMNMIQDKNNSGRKSAYIALAIIGLVVSGTFSRAHAEELIGGLYVPSGTPKTGFRLPDVSLVSLRKPKIPVAIIHDWDGPGNSVESIDPFA